MQPFKPTHQIVHSLSGSITTEPVMLVEEDEGGAGPAYTQAEWEASARADWERQEDGSWMFQGKPARCVVTEAQSS